MTDVANTAKLFENMHISVFTPELCMDIVEQYVSRGESATLPPVELAEWEIDGNLVIWVNVQNTLRSFKPLNHDYQARLRQLALDAHFPRLTLHVLNFDFTSIITEYFSKLTQNAFTAAAIAAQRLEIKMSFNSDFTVDRGDESHIHLELRHPANWVLVTPKVTADLQAWIDFLPQQQAAGKPFHISAYEWIKMDDDDAELENIRDAISTMNMYGRAAGEFLRILLPGVDFVKTHYGLKDPQSFFYRDQNRPTVEAPGSMG